MFYILISGLYYGGIYLSDVDTILDVKLLRERRSTIKLIVDILAVALTPATKCCFNLK